jgi:Transposase IS66 family
MQRGRSRELGPVIRMNDALAANWIGEEERIECCCLTHARRKFAELEKFYPQQCGYALDRIGGTYQNDAATKVRSDEERLTYYQKYSGVSSSNGWIRSWKKGE